MSSRQRSREPIDQAGSVVEAIETPDEHTVVFRMAEPYGPLLQRLDVTEAPILPKHVFEAGGDPNQHPANLQPIGTGPYRFVDDSQDDTITLERNADDFKPGLPKLERLIFRAIPDSTTQPLALEEGEVDHVNCILPADVERLREQGDITLVDSSTGPGGGNCIITMSFNLERDLPLVGSRAMGQASAHRLQPPRPMMDTLSVLDQSDVIELTFDDLKKFHGTKSICGLTVSFKVMQAAFDALASGAPIKRSELSVATAFPGPGARDGFEMVMRALTREKYRIERDVQPSEKIAEAAKGAYFFRIAGNGRVAALGLKPEVVPPEFVPLRRRQLQGEFSEEETEKFRRLQFAFSDRLLSINHDDAVNLLSLDDDASAGDVP